MSTNRNSDPKFDAKMSSRYLVGLRLGDYQVLRRLGRGGMADVYAARHLTLGRDVAMKVLQRQYAQDKDYVERFRREARAAARLNHPNIVQVYDVGNVDSLHYITQELIDGENLREHLQRRGTLSAEEAIEVIIGVASALEIAAEAGITHRDIKPENIMRSSRGIVKVADFGLARLGPDVGTSQANLTQAGLTLGTPRYMSPEQIQGHTVDVRSDLYSLGVTMYHLLAGRPPFEAEDALALAVLHLHETPMPLDRARGASDLPEALIAIISRLMSKLPKDRFQSPRELLDLIRGESPGSTFTNVGTAAATIRLQRMSQEEAKRARQNRYRTLALVLLPAMCVAGTAFAFSRRTPPSVSRILRPELVTKTASVESQYLVAVRRNDPAGWRAVADYFPPSESAVNAEYYAKSTLQLASCLAKTNELKESDRVLGLLLANPKVDRLYLALALAQRCAVQEALGGGEVLSQSLTRLRALYQELKTNNPTDAEIFDEIVSEKDRTKLQLDNAARAPAASGEKASLPPVSTRPRAANEES